MRLAISMKLIWHKSEEMSNQPYCGSIPLIEVYSNPFVRHTYFSTLGNYLQSVRLGEKGLGAFISVQTLESQHKLTRDRVIYASGPAYQFRLQKGKNTLLIEQDIFD